MEIGDLNSQWMEILARALGPDARRVRYLQPIAHLPGVRPEDAMMPSATAYRMITERIAHTRETGSLRQAIDIDTWVPLVHRHRPAGPALGDPCLECSEPWPCGSILGVLRSGVFSPGPARDS